MLGGEAGRYWWWLRAASAEYGMGLSEPVAAAVDEAVRIVLDLVGGRGDRAAGGTEQDKGKGRTPCALAYPVR